MISNNVYRDRVASRFIYDIIIDEEISLPDGYVCTQALIHTPGLGLHTAWQVVRVEDGAACTADVQVLMSQVSVDEIDTALERARVRSAPDDNKLENIGGSPDIRQPSPRRWLEAVRKYAEDAEEEARLEARRARRRGIVVTAAILCAVAGSLIGLGRLLD